MYLKNKTEVTAPRRILPAQNIVMPTAREWWRSSQPVLLIFTILVGFALLGSFVSYERIVVQGHPWLPARVCPGCSFCGMTRSFCAMSSGRWREALNWNRGGPPLYACFWIWSVCGFTRLLKSTYGTKHSVRQVFALCSIVRSPSRHLRQTGFRL
jgi:hypothetical protein